jgi:hypothetical protein
MLVATAGNGSQAQVKITNGPLIPCTICGGLVRTAAIHGGHIVIPVHRGPDGQQCPGGRLPIIRLETVPPPGTFVVGPLVRRCEECGGIVEVIYDHNTGKYVDKSHDCHEN